MVAIIGIAPGMRRDPGWLRDRLWQRAQRVPTLDLRFAANRSLRDAVSGRELVTFTRASSATVVNAAGTIETLGNDVPRFQHDPITGACLGLLVEEQRQNLLLNSATLSTQSVTSAATAYTLSFYGAGTVTLSGTSTAGPLVGTGANARVSLTFTPTAGTLTLTVSGSVTSANLEAGSFATSWIPTTGTSATRSADIATITGANFSEWYNQSQGTVHSAFLRSRGISSTSTVCSVNDGTLNNRCFNFRQDSSTGLTFISVTGGSTDMGSSLTISSSSAMNYVAVAQALNNAAGSAEGQAPVTDSAVAMPVVNQLSIGSVTSSSYFNGTISRLTYWNSRLPNAALQALTA
jgi:hypothetical protein